MIKAVNLLTWLTCEPEPRTAKEAAVACGLPLPTAYHLLDTLVAEGMLSKDARRCYHSGPRLGLIVDAYSRRSAQPEHLTAPLRRLAEITGETTYLSGFRDGDVTVLASVEGNQAVRVSGLHVGFRGFAHARASGKVLLAHAPPDLLERYLETSPRESRTPNTIVETEALRAELRAIASVGYAFDRDEWVEGVSGVSAPGGRARRGDRGVHRVGTDRALRRAQGRAGGRRAGCSPRRRETGADLSMALIYIEYISRKPGVDLELFHTVAGGGQSGWADDYAARDQKLLNLGRTWRMGAEPEYMAVWNSPKDGLERLDEWETIFRSGEADHFEGPFRLAARIDIAGCYEALIEPVRGSLGRYYSEHFEIAPGATHDDVRRLLRGAPSPPRRPRAEPRVRPHRRARARSARARGLGHAELRRARRDRPRTRRRVRADPPRAGRPVLRLRAGDALIKLGVDTLCWHLRLESGAVTMEDVFDQARELGCACVGVTLHHVRDRDDDALRTLAARAGPPPI